MRKGRTRLPLVRAEPGAPSVKVKIVRILTSESIALSVGVDSPSLFCLRRSSSSCSTSISSCKCKEERAPLRRKCKKFIRN